MRGECVHTHDYSADDDNPTSVSQKGKMGEERRGGEAGMNAAGREGGQKIDGKWDRRAVTLSVSRGGGGVGDGGKEE